MAIHEVFYKNIYLKIITLGTYEESWHKQKYEVTPLTNLERYFGGKEKDRVVVKFVIFAVIVISGNACGQKRIVSRFCAIFMPLIDYKWLFFFFFFYSLCFIVNYTKVKKKKKSYTNFYFLYALTSSMEITSYLCNSSMNQSKLDWRRQYGQK